MAVVMPRGCPLSILCPPTLASPLQPPPVAFLPAVPQRVAEVEPDYLAKSDYGKVGTCFVSVSLCPGGLWDLIARAPIIFTAAGTRVPFSGQRGDPPRE